MACSYTNTRQQMIDKGIINNYNNLVAEDSMTISRFNQYAAYIKQLARQKFSAIPEGINNPVKLEGKKVIFNDNFFDWVDKKNSQMLQIDSSRVEGEDKELNRKLKNILQSAGIDYKAVEEIKDSNGNPIQAVAVADFLTNTVKVIEGKAKIDTLPEEVAHFYIAALPKDSPVYRVMYDKVTGYNVYKQVLAEYSETYTEEKQFREEAMGKLIAQAIVGQFQDSKHKAWWEKVWDWIKSKLGILSSERLENELFFNAASDILQGGLKKISDGKGQLYQLDTVNKDIANKLVSVASKYSKQLVENEKIKGVGKKYLDASGKTERYVKEDGTLLNKRVTDEQSKLFIDKMGVEKAKQIDSTPDNIIKRDTGTLVHATIEATTRKIINESTSKFLNKDFTDKSQSEEEIKNIAGLNKAQYLHIEKGVKDLIHQITEQQKEISPDGQVIILTETTLADEKRSLGGSVDILAIFSDGSVSIYDYKTITPNAVYLNKGELIADPIPFYKKTSYNVQMVQYKEMLTDIYGVKGFRQTRVVPIRMDFKLKAKKDRSEGSYLLKDINKLEFADNTSKFLKQLPLRGELTGDKNLDDFISKQEKVLHNLEVKLENERLSGKDKSNIIDKVERYKRSLTDLRVSKNYNSTIDDAVQLVTEIEKRVGIDDKENELYASTATLQEYIYDLTSFQSLNHSLSNLELTEPEEITVHVISGKIMEMINVVQEKILQRIEELAHSKGEDLKELSTIDISIFSRFSEANHPAFRTFYKLVNERQEAIRSKVNELHKELEDATKKLKESGSTFDDLINPLTGNMYDKLNKEFKEKRGKAWREVDIPELMTFYNFKEGKSPEDYGARLTKYIESQKALGLEGIALEEKVRVWKLYNDPTKEFYWKKGNAKYDIELKPEVYTKYKSDDFKKIESNPALLNFYNIIEKRNREFRNLLDLEYKTLPDNFLPNIRSEFVDKIMSGQFAFGEHVENMLDSLKVNEDRERFTKMVNPVTGELELTVPVFYINPIKSSEKSKEIAQSILIFGKMAYNYQQMSTIEADVAALKYLLENNKIEILERDKRGERYKNFMGEWATKLGVDKKALDYFEQWQRYYIYGIKMDNSAIAVDTIGNTDYSKTKVLLAMKNYVAANVLGLNVIGAAGAYTASRINLYYEGIKGLWYDSNSSNKASATMATDWKKYHALGEYFEPFADDRTRLKAHNLKLSNVSKYVSAETIMAPYRKVDERIDLQILNSMSHYWGVDEDGSVKRLDKLKKQWEKRGLKKIPKSVWELTRYDAKTDELVVEGLSQEGMRMFRNAVREAKSNITGLLTEDDINQANINIYTNLLMQFKNWMPGMYKERFGDIKYYRDYDIVQQGKYAVIGKELFAGKTSEESWSKVAAMFIWSATKMAGDIATFGLSKKLFGGFYKINEEAARLEYEQYLSQHPESRNLEFEDFVEMKQRQLASGLAEFRMLLLIAMLVMMAGGDWDDDGHPDYRDNYALRQLYKVILKAQMELGFSTNPKDVITLLGKGLLPISKVLVDIANTFGNTVDESRDIVFGENSSQDKTPVGYYSTRWIKGVNGLRKTVDWFYEQDKTPAGAK